MMTKLQKPTRTSCFDKEMKRDGTSMTSKPVEWKDVDVDVVLVGRYQSLWNIEGAEIIGRDEGDDCRRQSP